MKIPSAARALIADDKIRDYLLNRSHRRGASKAHVLFAMGYQEVQWQQLQTDLRKQHLTADVDRIVDTAYGRRYEIHAPLTGPSGRMIVFRSVWQVDVGASVARLITMYPD